MHISNAQWANGDVILCFRFETACDKCDIIFYLTIRCLGFCLCLVGFNLLKKNKNYAKCFFLEAHLKQIEELAGIFDSHLNFAEKQNSLSDC